MEKFGIKREKSEQFSVSEALDRLQKAADIFRDMGLEVIDRNITEDNLATGLPIPIVKDGLDGVRATYSKRTGLEIFFTNGFEDSNNPKRLEIEKRLKEIELL